MGVYWLNCGAMYPMFWPCSVSPFAQVSRYLNGIPSSCSRVNTST